MVQAEDILVDIAAEEAQAAGGGLKKLKEIATDFEGMTAGEGQMTLLSTADKIPVWNIHTGRRSDILRDQLKFQMKKRFPPNHPLAGQRCYSLQPVEAPALAELKCLLHPDHKLRSWLDGIGLKGRTCMTDKIPTEYAVKVHMQRKHTTAHTIIMEERGKEEAHEAADLQRAQLKAMERLASGNDSQHEVGPTLHYCRIEGCERFFDKEAGRDLHEKKAHKE